MNEQLVAALPAELVRQATDIAGLCKEIVLKTAVDIQGRKYVKVEGWMSIATAHGCVASARDVEKVPGGMRAIAEIRRMSDGVVLCTAEGYVGEDEPVWYGGPDRAWNKIKNCMEDIVRVKRADYAIRAMAQTRAVSRACRTAFAHVVVLMQAGLSTTPAEEQVFEEAPEDHIQGDPVIGKRVEPIQPGEGGSKPAVSASGGLPPGVKWRDVAIHFGKNRGIMLSDLSDDQISWYHEGWTPKPYGKATDISEDDKLLKAAINAWLDEKSGRTDAGRR